ncbi:hypothetical protein HDU97_006906 [Phlyctochytrium planicorne]|nr:hypothetical protein HDU97_006906 [Phlyctochytrium planicorne]
MSHPIQRSTFDLKASLPSLPLSGDDASLFPALPALPAKIGRPIEDDSGQTASEHPDANKDEEKAEGGEVVGEIKTEDYGVGKKKKKVTLLVARQVPVDMFGKDPQYTEPHKKPVPLSLLIPGVEHGPRIDPSTGHVLPHTLLGDPQDYLDMLALTNPPPPELEISSSTPPPPVVNKEDEEKERKRKGEERKRRKKMMERLHVFQRYRETRESHALRNWKRHSVEWAKVERGVAEKIGKQPHNLLMCQLGAYREKIEEQELIEEAVALLEQREIGFWAPGLRIGNDLLGLMVTMPSGGPRGIERVVTNEKQHFNKMMKSNSYREQRKHELRELIAGMDPFFNLDQNQVEPGGFLEIRGHGLNQPHNMEHLAEAYLQRLEERSRGRSSLVTRGEESTTMASGGLIGEDSTPEETKPSRRPTVHETKSKSASSLSLRASAHNILPPIDILPEVEIDKEEEVPKGEVRILMAAQHMTFHTLLGEVSTSVMTVYNIGTTKIAFEWRKAEGKGAGLNIKNGHDGIQRFYFPYKSGVILPGSAFDFKIVFKSASPGIFSEAWAFHTQPELKDTPVPVLTLQGIAIEPDTFKSKREEIEAKLERRQAETIAKEVIQSILASIRPRRMPESGRKRMLAAQDEYMFLQRNGDLNVTYSPTTFGKFLALSEDVAVETGRSGWVWDRCIMSLYQVIDTIQPVERRSQFFQRLNDLVDSAREPANSTAYPFLYIVCYDMFIDLADRIAECSESGRKKLGLPLNRAAAQFFREGDENKGDDDDGRKDGSSSDPNRKTTPPQAAQAEEKGKKGAPAGAKDAKGKAAAAAPKAGNAGKPSGKKGGDVAAGKFFSQPFITQAEETPLRPALAKIGLKVPTKPDSSNQWTRERKLAEIQYKRQFTSEVSALVQNAIFRVCNLFEDVDAGQRDRVSLLGAGSAGTANSSSRPSIMVTGGSGGGDASKIRRLSAIAIKGKK